MSDRSTTVPQRSNAYNIFIFVLIIFSLGLMVLRLLPITEETLMLVNTYDNLACIVFLYDFFLHLTQSPSKKDYFIGRRGWLDLLGSIPTIGLFKYAALLRLARISRLARVRRALRGKNKKQLVEDVLRNRGQYAAFVTVLSAFIVLTVASILVLQFESTAPGANITTGGDAMWWAIVTITTVGYGDKYPITPLGRLTAVLVMVAGVGIIGALASILASILIPPPPASEGDGEATPDALTVQQELAQVSMELAALRQLIVSDRSDSSGSGNPW